LSESIRADWDQSYKWVMVPQFNLAWSPSNITLRTSIGKSIRDADFTERYNNYNKTLVRSGSIGNPMLDAEKAWNMELGMDLKIQKSLEIKSSVFRRMQQNLIDWTPTSYSSMPRKVNLISTGTYALANNIASITTSGFEVDFLGVVDLNEKKKISYKSGLTYLNSSTPSGTNLSFYISSHARWLVSNSIIFQLGNTFISYSSLYKSRKPQQTSNLGVNLTKNYMLHHIKVEQRLIQKKLGLYIQVENLTDVKYSDLLGSIMPGRWWSGGLSVDLR
jgi:iron complex outermembrane receptor protein